MNTLHGGNVYQAEAEFGFTREALLDFSANINPLGTPATLKDAIRKKLDRLNDYPDPEYLRLRTSISRYVVQTPMERIIVGNGASEIIFLLFATLRPQRVLIVTPTFSEYAPAALKSGAKVDYFPLAAADDFRVDLGRLAEKARNADCLMICNPNNPTSTLLTIKELLFLADTTKQAGTALIIDEAFIELTPGGNANSLISYLPDYPQLFLIRAFTKIFAVPGLRVGYGLGAPGLIAAMRRAQLPWSVNLLADGIADFLPYAQDYLRRTQEWLGSELEWLAQALREIHGLRIFEPQTNFILMKIVKGMEVSSLQKQLGQKGILIRAAANFYGLDGSYFRVAVKERKNNSILVTHLREVLDNAGEFVGRTDDK